MKAKERTETYFIPFYSVSYLKVTFAGPCESVTKTKQKKKDKRLEKTEKKMNEQKLKELLVVKFFF